MHYVATFCRRCLYNEVFQTFPVDANTYMEVRIEKELPSDIEIYNRFHALIVHNGKNCKESGMCRLPVGEVL